MLYSITHRTTYAYNSDASHSHHLAHLRPRVLPRQDVIEFTLRVDPGPSLISDRSDYHGNAVTFFTMGAPHRRLAVFAQSRVLVRKPEWPAFSDTPPWEQVRAKCSSNVLNDDSVQGEFCFDSPHISRSSEYAEYAAPSFPAGRPLVEGVMEFTGRIFRDFKFDPRATSVATPLEEVFEKRRGVCQDFAHLGIACLRSLGLPARYVSGYLETVPPPGKMRLVGADASHAWFSVWCPGFGWVDADPTNNMLAGERHITLAWGRDFSEVSPLRGVVVGGGRHILSVGVDVTRAKE